MFPIALRVANFLAVSDSPIRMDRDRWAESLSRFTIEGVPVLDLHKEEGRRRFEKILSIVDTLDTATTNQVVSIESEKSLRRRYAGKRLITDDNMGTEW